MTVDDLRTAYADLDASVRPSLATREDRRAFVQRLVERTLLVDEGERLLAADAAAGADLRSDRDLFLVRRLRTLEAGGAPIESAAVAAAYERMRTAHEVEAYYFSREEDARAAKAAYDASAEGRQIRASDRSTTWVTWSPFPDPVADAVVDLPLSVLAGPLKVGGAWRLVRVRGRKPNDPGPLEPLRPRIFLGLRARGEAAAVEALAQRLRGVADVRVEGSAVELLAARTREKILRPESTEQDDAWAIPALTTGEESTRVATWRDGVLTAGDYVRVVRREPRNQRPRSMLAAEVRRTVDSEVTLRLLVAEAERRGLEEDHWVRRSLERSRQDRALQKAIAEIERTEHDAQADSSVDSLAARLHATQPGLFERAARARVLRFDFATAEAGREEVERIRRAGGAEARLEEILEDGAPAGGPFHLIYMTPTEMPSADVVAAIFAGGPGAVTGPHRQGDSWVVLACLDLRPSTRPNREEIIADFRRRIADTNEARRVDAWLERRKKEVGVQVDEAALDALAPGG
jgi:parvulin-like peptidyl-prolyl isomerase